MLTYMGLIVGIFDSNFAETFCKWLKKYPHLWNIKSDVYANSTPIMYVKDTYAEGEDFYVVYEIDDFMHCIKV